MAKRDVLEILKTEPEKWFKTQEIREKLKSKGIILNMQSLNSAIKSLKKGSACEIEIRKTNIGNTYEYRIRNRANYCESV